MVGQVRLRLIKAGATDLAPEIRDALVKLTEHLDEKTCFVLTRAGVLRARANPTDPTTFHLCRDDATTPTDAICTPRWAEKARVLTVGGPIVKQYKRPSPNQEIILKAFEAEGWPYHINDPLPLKDEIAPKTRLHDTIRWLNLNQECRLLRFLGDGTGRGLRWELVTVGGLVLHGDPAQMLRPAA